MPNTPTISYADWNSIKNNRVRVYIDWFNFYHNLREKFPNKKNYQWLNYRKLIENELKENEKIDEVFLFTAYYSDDRRSERYIRHNTLIQALTSSGVKVILGKFIKNSKTLYTKQIDDVRPTDMDSIVKEKVDEIDYVIKEEKKTDVNLAIKIVQDAYEDNFDIAYVITGDTDIVPAVELVKRNFWSKIIINARIDNSLGRDIQKACDDFRTITSEKIKKSLLPDRINFRKGRYIEKPKEWISESTLLSPSTENTN